MESSRRAVFFDKDGTLLHDVPYNVDVGRVSFREDALPALMRLQEAGYRLLMVSNQPGVALGRILPGQLQTLKAYLMARLLEEGIRLDGFYSCPHLPGSPALCSCRKPQPGMLLRAAREHRLTLEESWMVGDILDDVEAGNRAGCRTVLLDVGNETRWEAGLYRSPHRVARSLTQAADAILSSAAIATPSPVP